jgi:hypothetical protein
MAKLSARRRLTMAIDRIRRAGWTAGAMRDAEHFERNGGKWVTYPAGHAPVCLIGALHTDREYRDTSAGRVPLLVQLPGMCEAADELVAVTGAMADVPTTLPPEIVCERKLRSLIGWNDGHSNRFGKRAALRALRMALTRLDKKKKKS